MMAEATILVNGVEVLHRVLAVSHERLVNVAFPDAQEGAVYTVTWSRKGGKIGGSLKPNSSDVVAIKEGTRFDVVEVTKDAEKEAE